MSEKVKMPIRKNNLKSKFNDKSTTIVWKRGQTALIRSFRKFRPWYFCSLHNWIGSNKIELIHDTRDTRWRVIRCTFELRLHRGWSAAEIKPGNFESSLPNSLDILYSRVPRIGRIRRKKKKEKKVFDDENSPGRNLCSLFREFIGR